jgi:uncharacterized protein (TIGR03067 family)
MVKHLHSRPNLLHLRGQAKALLSALKAGDPTAAQTLVDHLPAARGMSPEQALAAGFRLADAQSAIARMNGFASWPKLAHHVEELRSLEGEWEFESLQVDGGDVAPQMLSGSRLLIDGDRFRMESPMANYDGEFGIDVDEAPQHIDIEFVEGPEAGNWSYGIFRLEGDRLTICLGLTGASRPADFTTSSGSGHALETLRRVTRERPAGVSGGQRQPAPEGTPAAETPAWEPVEFGPEHARLEGRWSATRITADGQTLPQQYLKGAVRIGQGTRVTVSVMGSQIMDAELRIRDAATPIEVDHLISGTDGQRYVQLGIMRWDGAEMTSCFAPPGQPRPAEFSAEKGSAHTLSSWRKVAGGD